MHDLVIRNGSVIDGTGAPAQAADVAIDGDRVVTVGQVEGDGRRTIDEIIQELKAEFPSVEPGRIEAEVTTFLERLHQKRVIDLE